MLQFPCMSLVTILKTNIFEKWFNKLKDRQAKSIILIHIGRMTNNNFGVTKSVGSGIFEKKIYYGPGYRLYYCCQGQTWVLLLCGGDKSTQNTDVKEAKQIKENILCLKK